MTGSTSLAPLLWFAAVVLLIPLALWLLKRTPIGGAASGGVLRTVAMLPVSGTQRIVALEVGQGDERRWLVLGVTAQSITTLHTMLPHATTAGAAPPAAPAFADLFARLRKRGDGAPDA